LQKEIKLAAKKSSKTKKLIVVVVVVWIGIFIGVGAIIALVLSGTIQLGGSNTAEGVAPLARLEEGSLANDFTLNDLEGGNIRLSDLRGKPVVLNYWATWCVPCVEEMPMFQAYSEQYSNFTMIGINQAEGIDKVAPFVERMGLTYPVLLDLNSKVSQAYKVFLLPTTFFIDEEGMIRFRHYGIMTQDQFQYYLRTLGAVE
jgi:peroxiredoxin